MRLLRLQADLPARPGGVHRAKAGDPRLATFAERIRGHPMTTGVLVDELARSRIAGELGANLCVEAAAGTGKTTVLVERVANLLAAGVVTVDELVVITFTEKAAAELSTRVRDELERRAAEAEDEQSASGCWPRRATCTGRTSRRSTASRPRCCASGRSRRASTRCSTCSRGSPPASTSTPRTSASRTSCWPATTLSSSGRCDAGSASQELREACEHLHAAPLPAPARASRPRRAASLDADARRAARRSPTSCGRCCARTAPATTSWSTWSRADRRVDRRAGGARHRPSRSGCSYPARGRRRTRGWARTRTGAGQKQRVKDAPGAATRTRSTAPS